MKHKIALVAAIAAILLFPGRVVLGGAESKVYLVPIEAEPELLQSLKAYYKRELALEVEVLPSLRVTSAVWDTRRGQAIAERFIELLDTHYGNVDSRNSIIIGITSRDFYIEEIAWRYAFSWREDGRLAIVSYARLDPSLNGEPDSVLLETRLRKMVTRNICVMRYGLPLTADRDDLMYQDILGLDDLDNLIEDLHDAGFPMPPPRPAAPVIKPRTTEVFNGSYRSPRIPRTESLNLAGS